MDDQKSPRPAGLVCPACRKVPAIIEKVTPRGVQFYCPECKHSWTTHAPTQKK